MDNNIFLLAITTYVVIISIGNLIHKYLRMPWMFTVVIFGIFLSAMGFFRPTFESANFLFLSQLGMLFFLFMIGVDLDLKQIRQLGKYIFFGNILLTLAEGGILGAIFYFFFPAFVNNSFLVAMLAGIAFGTVGEVILLAILKEFGLEKTQFGQLALGIGVMDDIFEIGVLAVIVALPAFIQNGNTSTSWAASIKIIMILAAIIMITVLISLIGNVSKNWFEKINLNSFTAPLLIFLPIFSYFHFSSLEFESMSVIAAIFSGIAVQGFLPEKIVSQYKKPIYFMGNMFLGPFFFLSMGYKISFDSLLVYPGLILIIVLTSVSFRVIVSYFFFKKILGKKQAAVLGVGLCSKFSTSVISENLLYTSGMIASPLYSAIMAAFILMKPVIIGVFSRTMALLKDRIV